MKTFMDFLEKLEQHNIYYTLDKSREGYIRVDIAVPGERWEVEFSADHEIVVERFKSVGDVFCKLKAKKIATKSLELCQPILNHY